jgi:hypothetical protein
VNVALNAPGNHLSIVVMPIGKHNQSRNKQRVLLQKSKHGQLFTNKLLTL